MIYAYVRVSTDKQTVENQRFEIAQFCSLKNIEIESWFEETTSGSKNIQDRRLGSLIRRLRKGDILICSELSRLGRSLFMIMEILAFCMRRGVILYTVKEQFTLGADIPSKVLAFAFSLSAEIERSLISQRTREALLRAKNDGKTLGHPKGKNNRKTKLAGKETAIECMLKNGTSISEMARILHVHRNTLRRFIDANLYKKHTKNKRHP